MSETIEDIVRSIAERNRRYRIEAANNEQLTDGTMCTMSCRTDGELLQQYAESEKRLAAEVEKLRNELAAEMRTCERLRAALRPVLACPCTANTTADEAAHNCMDAVADALHIWRIGVEGMHGGEI